MKRIVLLGLLIAGTTCVMAQGISRKDSLLNTMKSFRLPGLSSQMPNTFKLTPKDSLLGRLYNFKVPDADTVRSFNSKTPIKQSGVYHSPVDHMPIAVLPSNSRMPVYKLQQSNDKMPGSNLPQTVTPVTPQK